MSNDATPIKLTGLGRVIVDADGVTVEGFAGCSGSSCRDVAILAAAWAIGVLQCELVQSIEAPGGSGRLGIC